jgi:hypothetical protein
MEAVRVFETSVTSYQSTLRNNPADSHLQTMECLLPKPFTVLLLLNLLWKHRREFPIRAAPSADIVYRITKQYEETRSVCV